MRSQGCGDLVGVGGVVAMVEEVASEILPVLFSIP